MSHRLHGIEPSVGDVPCGHVQHCRSAVLHQLQRRLRVSTWFNVVDTSYCDVCRRSIQRAWCDVVRQLQRGLCVPGCVDVVNTSDGDVSCWYVQPHRRPGLLEL
jgi:hypothetical protein